MADTIDILRQLLESGKFNELPEPVRKKLLETAGVQDKSLTARAKRFVTGEGSKEFDYPDFDPSYLDPKYTPFVGSTQVPNISYRPPDDRALSYNATVHDDARLDVLSNYRPDIAQTVKKDKYGVPYVIVNGKPQYLNRPGASAQDAREAGAVALAAAPLVSRGRSLTVEGQAAPKTFIQKGLTSPSVIARGSTAAGVGTGASVLQDLVAQKGGAKGGVDVERAALSGGLSTATMFAWPLIRALGVKSFQSVFSKPTLIKGEFTVDAMEAFRKAGIDPKVFDEAEKAQIAKLMAEATDPSALAAAEEALRLEPPVRLTKGQATGDRAQQAMEYQAREGLMGQSAKEQMERFDVENRAATAQNIQGMRKKIIGDVPPNEYNIGVGQAQMELGQDRLAAKAKYKQLYDDVENSSDEQLAWIETPERFRQRLLNDKDVTGNLEFMPRLQKVLDDYEKTVMGLETGPIGPGGTTGSKAPSVNEMFEWRKRLQAQINGSDINQQRILIGVKREFDKFMKDTVADGLVRGDPKLIEMWKGAIKSRADYGRLFEGDDIVDRITTLTKNGAELAVDPHQAANLIFGASDAGFISKWNIVKNMELLKSRLTPASWNSLRGDALLRMFGLSRDELEAIAAGSAQLPSGQKFKTALESFRTKNAGLYRAMFDEEENRLINKVADVWKRVTVPRQGATDPSGSGLWVLQAGQRAVSGPVGSMLKELLAFAHPASRFIFKPIKGSLKAGAATGHGEGYYPPTKTLAPPAPMVSPVMGGMEERLLDRYENTP